MEKEMDMVQKMGIPVVLVIGTQNKFNFIQMMEQSLLIIQQQVNKQWGTTNATGKVKLPITYTKQHLIAVGSFYGISTDPAAYCYYIKPNGLDSIYILNAGTGIAGEWFISLGI